MRVKKINAILSLLSILLLLLHLGYVLFAYLTFYYNPLLTQLFAWPFVFCVGMHAALGFYVVLRHGNLRQSRLYARANLATLLQRITAFLMVPLLLVHINTFSLLQSSAGGGLWGRFGVILLVQVCFYGCVITHVALSLPRALITMGWLEDERRLRRLNIALYVLGAAVFAVLTFVIVRTQIFMFLFG